MNKNLVKINSGHQAQQIQPSKYDWSISNYLSYFYAHKTSIALFSVLSFLITFTFFLNKEYNTKISYTVNTNQSFQSNILASNFFGKSDNNVFSNLAERTYNHAKSRRFNKQLAQAILNDPTNSYIYKKAIGKDAQGKILLNETYNEELLELTDFFEERVYVRLKDENQILFSITTHDSLLTESIQKLINDYAKAILTKEPLKEVMSASKILENQLKETQLKLAVLDQQKINIQKNVNTVNPLHLAQKFSNLETSLEKDLFVQRSKYAAYKNKMSKIRKKLRYFPRDYSLQRQLQDNRTKRAEANSKIQSIKASIQKLKTESKSIPKVISDLKKIEREQDILLKTALKFTEKESLAVISIQKIKDSITLLSAEENIKSSNNNILLIKAFAITTFMLVLIFTFIYYKQSLFPSIFTREEFERTNLNVLTAFSDFKSSDKESDMLITVNNVSRDRIIDDIDYNRTISFMKIGSTHDSIKSMNSVIKKMLSDDKSIYVLNFNLTYGQRRFFRSLAKKHPQKFQFQNINEKLNNKSILNVDRIKSELSKKANFDHLVVNTLDLKSMANKALISSISDKVYTFATLNKTKYTDINNFIKLYNILATKTNLDLSLILTRSKSGDNISSFLNQKINGSDDEKNLKAS